MWRPSSSEFYDDIYRLTEEGLLETRRQRWTDVGPFLLYVTTARGDAKTDATWNALREEQKQLLKTVQQLVSCRSIDRLSRDFFAPFARVGDEEWCCVDQPTIRVERVCPGASARIDWDRFRLVEDCHGNIGFYEPDVAKEVDWQARSTALTRGIRRANHTLRHAMRLFASAHP